MIIMIKMIIIIIKMKIIIIIMKIIAIIVTTTTKFISFKTRRWAHYSQKTITCLIIRSTVKQM